jgi:FkbM family methyltransferase
MSHGDTRTDTRTAEGGIRVTGNEQSPTDSETDEDVLVSYAQHGEDIVLWRAFRNQKTGTYIDVGAFHPTYDSVTRLFYDRGWRGINIEPIKSAIDEFERERPDDVNLRVAASDEDGELDFFICDIPGWSTTNPVVADGLTAQGHAIERVTVAARRLSSILDERPDMTVDFLKIDAEGAEASVLSGLDFERHRPRVIVVEGVAPVVDAEVGSVAISMIESAGYTHAGFDGLNHYFTQDPTLVPALQAPANPTDNYIRHDVLLMQQRIAELVELTEKLDREREKLAQENFDLAHSVKVFNEREPEIRALERWAQDLATQLEAVQAREADDLA